MNIIDKIKRFFIEKNVEEIVRQPNIKEIDELISNKIQSANETLNKRAHLLYTEIEEILDKIDKDLINLQLVDLSHRKTFDKIKQITEIGKEELTLTIKKLLTNLRKQKENTDIIEIKNELNKFYYSSAKSHFKATQLIGKEIEELTDSISKIRSLTENFIKENSELIKNKAMFTDLNNTNLIRNDKEKIRTDLKDKITKTEELDKKYRKELEEIIKEKEKIENSYEQKEKTRLLIEKNNKQELTKKTEFILDELIDKKILEKYIRIKKEDKLINEYIENPSLALINDTDLKILNTINKIKDMIRNNIISIKEPKKAIKKITLKKEDLLNLRDKIKTTTEDLNKINEKISAILTSPENLIIEKLRIENKIKENSEDLEILNKKHNKLTEEIEAIQSQILSQITQSKKL